MEEYDYQNVVDCRQHYSNFDSSYFKSLPVKKCHLNLMGISFEGKKFSDQAVWSTLFFGLSFLDPQMLGKNGEHLNLLSGAPYRFRFSNRKKLKLFRGKVKAIYSKKDGNSVDLGVINMNAGSFSDMELHPEYALTELVNQNGIGNLIHELGHSYDDSIDIDNPFWSEHSDIWRKVDKEDPIISKYAMVDEAESFAETVVAYLFDPFLKCYAPKRYEVMKGYILLSSHLYSNGIPFEEVDCQHERVEMAVKFTKERSKQVREYYNKESRF